ncbi:hypothetical protein QYF36_015730 [Acer negundo]|nr:hypothetical protein QYF36_015730 [Acer negundo]
MFLILSNNNLSGELPPSLQNCTSMDSLDLGDNKLSGNLPAWIGESMPSLSILRLRSNFFGGNIPSQICILSTLHILDLSHNNLSGFIPPCLGNLSRPEVKPSETEKYEGSMDGDFGPNWWYVLSTCPSYPGKIYLQVLLTNGIIPGLISNSTLTLHAIHQEYNGDGVGL